MTDDAPTLVVVTIIATLILRLGAQAIRWFDKLSTVLASRVAAYAWVVWVLIRPHKHKQQVLRGSELERVESVSDSRRLEYVRMGDHDGIPRYVDPADHKSVLRLIRAGYKTRHAWELNPYAYSLWSQPADR